MFVLPLARSTALAARAPSFASVFDRLFDESLDRFVGAARPDTRTPAMDVSERDDAYVVSFEVPGAQKDQLKVQIEGRRVVLSDVRASEVDAKPEAAKADGDVAPAPVVAAERPLYRERSSVAFARTVVLPAEVDQAKSQARFDNGVLTLTLAKKVPAGATQLAIA